MDPFTLAPMDEWNQVLLRNVHPPDWQNPAPQPRYHLVVIGAGTAGLVAAAGAAGLGARVALVERGLLGGDCLNVGCVPSKALVRAARAVADIRAAARFGLRTPESVAVDFPAVMARLRQVRSEISAHDAAERFRRLGIDLFFGTPQFLDRETVEVAGARLRFSRALIATGGRPLLPGIPGAETAGLLTNETIFSLVERPRRMVVLGGGPIGCELGQAFQRLGTEVTLVESMPRILPKDDPDAAAIVQDRLEREGIQLMLGAQAVSITPGAVKGVTVLQDGAERVLEAEAVLATVGRAPNVEGLQLEAAGIAYDTRHGITVDGCLRTSNPRIFAAGDVCMRHKFTHAADAAARIVVQNALFFGRKQLGAITMPWCTYTEPELAHVGLLPQEAEEQGIALDTYTVDFRYLDRAMLDGETDGLLKVHTRRGTGRILGATLVAAHAGESIAELALAISQGIPLGRLSSVIHPYPTQAEAIRKAADQYQRTRLTPKRAQLLRAFLRWR